MPNHPTKALLKAASAHARAIVLELRPRYTSDDSFAKALGVTQSAVNKFKNGKAELGTRMLLGIAHLSGRSLDDVCGFARMPHALDPWEIARLYLSTGATPQGVSLARARNEGRVLSPRECASRILDAERDLSLGSEDDTHIRTKNHA
jgi:transcriptional regulator with XRE-family HTH domain